MLPLNIRVNIHIGDLIIIELLRKTNYRIGKQRSNQYSIHFSVQQITDSIIKSFIIILIEKKLGYSYIIRLHLRSRFINSFGNSLPIFTVSERSNDSNKMVLFFRCQRTCHQVRLIMNHFQNGLHFLLVFFRYPSTIMNYPVYCTNRDSRHLGDVHNTNI